ncbi:hydantoinase B/oxoprolinase family protein [Hoeflea prorocentri]|uniref:Hydantoinase B/oxoprolinase family protein n=1 Tax=Hoeflea prorocentri TaxID=1922333 RepID=A0A9X3ZHD7_9HYPH|nr:hydantoinase B/oxoprolinase family protein [Hoeflea prorocentri]MCY6381687.1 hydantoinase B/oxoprolinase family protein [Hoeflea prorocentri]MDA5399487.1 hydantoinase B/oxoprolinase family protein [Hoeflea prorocentri]
MNAAHHRRRFSDSEIIALNVVWNRLISVCEEQASVLMRLAFGPIVREAGDLSAGVFNADGEMLAQAVTGTPGHVNTMAESVRLMLDRIPAASLQPGDVLMTNDPWLGAGHVFDFVVVTPAFFEGNLVGFLASTSHVVDVGGLGWSAEARSVFEEGVVVPVSKLRRGTELNEDILGIVTANSRVPKEARGDILSLLSCNDTGAARLCELMQEFGYRSLETITDFIFDKSSRGMREAIARVPDGHYENVLTLDGYDSPIVLRASLQVDGDRISVDLGGSSPAVERGINCPLNYSIAYASFGIRALLAGDIPNNAASLKPVTVTAPPGLVVSAERPAPVTARHVIGQALPDLVLGCLAEALPQNVLAESSGALWTMSISGNNEQPFSSLNVALGGMGARPGCDGLSTTAFPSGVGSVPVEIAETSAPLVYHRKELTTDSGGAGQYRGGLGQTMEISARHREALTLSAAAFERLTTSPSGRSGGLGGAKGRVEISDGTVVVDKGLYQIPPGARLILHTPGGGGFGNPENRDREALKRDLAHDLVSEEMAQKLYQFKNPTGGTEP